MLTRIESRLHDTALGRSTTEEDPLTLEFGEKQVEGSVIKG